MHTPNRIPALVGRFIHGRECRHLRCGEVKGPQIQVLLHVVLPPHGLKVMVDDVIDCWSDASRNRAPCARLEKQLTECGVSHQ